MVTNTEVVKLALKQSGDQYIFGWEVDLDDPDPDIFDCSELIQWLGAQLGIFPVVPDGSWYQYRHAWQHSTVISVQEAISTPGALLFRFSSDPLTGGRPRSAHVALSLGDGATIEARGSAWGVGSWAAYGRGWTHAALLPGVEYEKGNEDLAILTDQEQRELQLMLKLLKDMDSSVYFVEPAVNLIREERLEDLHTHDGEFDINDYEIIIRRKEV